MPPASGYSRQGRIYTVVVAHGQKNALARKKGLTAPSSMLAAEGLRQVVFGAAAGSKFLYIWDCSTDTLDFTLSAVWRMDAVAVPSCVSLGPVRGAQHRPSTKSTCLATTAPGLQRNASLQLTAEAAAS